MLNFLRHIVKNRFYLFLIFFILFIGGNYYFTGNLFPSTELKDLWFYSGIFMVLFSILFIEPYYTSPKNVITNTVPLILVFLSIHKDFPIEWLWISCFTALLILLILSIIPLALEDKNSSPEHIKNRISDLIKRIVTFLGKGKIIYSAVFIIFLYINVSSKGVEKIFDSYFIYLLLLWGVILLISPSDLQSSFSFKKKKIHQDAIGDIFGVQSKKIFLVKLFDDRKSIKKFDIIKFRYSMQEENDYTLRGIVFDTYLLNQEKWAKILQLGIINSNNSKLEKNIAYKVSDTAERKELQEEMRVKDFVGIITDGSGIGKIRFEYSKFEDNLQEGDLLELELGENQDRKRLFYQVVSGSTEKEKLEARNETGFIEGEAIQLGEWVSEKLSFQKFGWLPSINTPVFIANTDDIILQTYTYPEYKLGVVPNTKLPSVINLNDAVSHHMALLGVTGSGKSFLAREIIKELQTDTKVICVDFNKEFANTIAPPPENIINDTDSTIIFANIDWINNELGKFDNQQNKTDIERKKNEINNKFKESIKNFIEGNTSISVFELPEVSNSKGILDYTKNFFSALFEVSKEYQRSGAMKRICVVLEEAHTVVPEWNFAGSSDKTSQGLVNSIGQIALQGRKYGVGFMVIAQRTANVSKTILTQCNTVICFQAFDETSFAFLGNYIGKDLVQALPNLKQYQAVVTGKAIKSNLPMIVDLKRTIEVELPI